jgi:hypothetical protein
MSLLSPDEQERLERKRRREMETCEGRRRRGDHQMIAFDDGHCPLCDMMGLLDEKDVEIKDLSKQVDNLEAEIGELKG